MGECEPEDAGSVRSRRLRARPRAAQRGRAACGSSRKELVLTTAHPAGPRERNAERLEDRLEHVLRIFALDQPDVQRQPGALGELLQEARDDVFLETRYVGRGEIDVRDDE